MARQHSLLTMSPKAKAKAKAKAKTKANAKARTGKAMDDGDGENSKLVTVGSNLYRQGSCFFVQKMSNGKCIRKSFGTDRVAAEKFLEGLHANKNAKQQNGESKKPLPKSAGTAVAGLVPQKLKDCRC